MKLLKTNLLEKFSLKLKQEIASKGGGCYGRGFLATFELDSFS